MVKTGAGKTVLVTGATGALGSVVVATLAGAGWKVIGTYFAEPKAPKSEPGVEWLKMDVTNSHSVHDSLRGHEVDALVHCAGAFRFVMTDQVQDQDLDFLITLNLKSSFLMARELLPGMKKRGFGRIVFVSARATLAPTAGMGAYAASKAGINALTQALADEVRGLDINVNAVLPTVIDTPANRREMPKADFGAWVSTQSLADVIESLIEPLGKPIHGALIPVSGRL